MLDFFIILFTISANVPFSQRRSLYIYHINFYMHPCFDCTSMNPMKDIDIYNKATVN